MNARRLILANIWVSVIAFGVAAAMAVMQALSRANLDLPFRTARMYYMSVTAHGVLMALDVEGFLDGENDGPATDEPARGSANADVIWRYDMRRELGAVPHFMSASTPAIDGDLLFVLTSTGVDETGVERADR